MSKTSQRKRSYEQLKIQFHQLGADDYRKGQVRTSDDKKHILSLCYMRGWKSEMKKASGKLNLITWFRNKFIGER